MKTGHDLIGLIKFLGRADWKEPLQDVLDEHLGPAMEAFDLEYDDINELLGDQWAMTLWGCAFEDFLTRTLEPDGRNLVDAYLKRRGWKEGAQTRAYIAALRTSIMSLYEVSEIVPGQSLLARDLIRGGEPVPVIGETRQPIPAEPGQPERYDYEYRRNGTANLFVFIDAHRPWRKVKVTDHRTAKDFAACMRDLVDIHYPDAERIRVVLDNLSTHSPGALYETFPPKDAHRILRRIEFHHTPKHASWLNMVEIEIGVLRTQCLDRRIADRHTLEREAAAWEKQRNHDQARVNWMFTTERARAKARQGLPWQRVIITVPGH